MFEEGLLTADDFFTDLNRRFFEYFSSAYSSGNDSFLDLNETFSEDEVGRLTKIKLGRMSLTDNGTVVLLEAIESLKNALNKKKSEANSSVDSLKELIQRKRADS